MLLTLMIATSSMTIFASAVLPARHEHAALGGYVVAILIGVLLAGCNAGIVNEAANALAFSSSYSTSRQQWWGRAFFLVIPLWLPLAAYLGDRASSGLTRLVA